MRYYVFAHIVGVLFCIIRRGDDYAETHHHIRHGFAHCVCKDAAVYFNPVDANDIADKLINLIDDKNLQVSLVEKGTEQLKQFGTSEDRAKGVLELCNTLIAKK